MQNGRDVWWHDEISKVDNACEAEIMDAEDPLFVLYTSGSTGKPKGVISSHLQNIKVFDYWSTYIGLNANDQYLIVNPYFDLHLYLLMAETFHIQYL